MITTNNRKSPIHLLLAIASLFAVCTLLAGCGSDSISGMLQPQGDRQAKETALKTNLQTIRTALTQFHTDTGCYPTRLLDLVVAYPPTMGVDSNGNPLNIADGAYKGPYFSPQGGIDNSGIPLNPFVSTPASDLSVDIMISWTYSNGIVHCTVPASGTTLDGIPYQDL